LSHLKHLEDVLLNDLVLDVLLSEYSDEFVHLFSIETQSDSPRGGCLPWSGPLLIVLVEEDVGMVLEHLLSAKKPASLSDELLVWLFQLLSNDGVDWVAQSIA
jgi:hypothetical protein